MVRSFEDDSHNGEPISMPDEKDEVLKLAINDYINERLNAISQQNRLNS